MKRILLVTCLLSILVVGCNDDTTTSKNRKLDNLNYRVTSPTNNSKMVCGEPLLIKLIVENEEVFQSIELRLNDSIIAHEKNVATEFSATIDTKNLRVGFHNLQFVLTTSSGKELVDNRSIIFFSDILPDMQVVKIIKEYPHLTTNYTQGLEFYKGKLFEGTGQKGQSMLAEINVQTGAIVRKVKLPDYMFGEGITILDDEVYQLTWEDRVCFVYDVHTFEKKREYKYFGEGWGLANDGTHLIMSNGTSEIVFRDPQTFEKIRSIYVFGSTQEYVFINELEYHDGAIYANVYQENFILKIDPSSGKVLAKIDCMEAVQRGKEMGDVLNGIAFSPNTQNFFITGKNWPKMFEVQFVEP